MTEQSGSSPAPWSAPKVTGLLVLADGTIIEGTGAGAVGAQEAEVCFNTAITGYQEILTDPSYAGQIVTFTFPHIGNVGANAEDVETVDLEKAAGVVGAIFKMPVTNPSNYRSGGHFNDWLKERDIIALCGIDTRALTAHIRESGLANAVIAHDPEGNFDREALQARAAKWGGLEGRDLVPGVTAKAITEWSQKDWVWNEGYSDRSEDGFYVVAMDFGVKRNILRLFAGLDCRVTVVPATTSADDILAMKPDGVFLSNGPGDPAATGEYAVPQIQKLVESGLPVFGICLGHQIITHALGAKTFKLKFGHRGGNQPVKNLETGKVSITAQNHGFAST
ncbi:MAG: glutamine-hydrolyzing carbamoyl-phosphate synthase small subunit, partial [Pseudomonadota bacterium]